MDAGAAVQMGEHPPIMFYLQVMLEGEGALRGERETMEFVRILAG